MAKHNKITKPIKIWPIGSKTIARNFLSTKSWEVRTVDPFYVKYTKMLSFSLVAEALTGLIYHRPSGENSNFQFEFTLACLVAEPLTGLIYHCPSGENSDFQFSSHLPGALSEGILMLTLKRADIWSERKARVDSRCLILGQTLTGS